MKFIKLPTKIALNEEIERNGDLGTVINWQDGYILANIDEIQEVVEGMDGEGCSIFYKSGDSSKIELTLDDMADLLESK